MDITLEGARQGWTDTQLGTSTSSPSFDSEPMSLSSSAASLNSSDMENGDRSPPMTGNKERNFVYGQHESSRDFDKIPLKDKISAGNLQSDGFTKSSKNEHRYHSSSMKLLRSSPLSKASSVQSKEDLDSDTDQNREPSDSAGGGANVKKLGRPRSASNLLNDRVFGQGSKSVRLADPANKGLTRSYQHLGAIHSYDTLEADMCTAHINSLFHDLKADDPLSIYLPVPEGKPENLFAVCGSSDFLMRMLQHAAPNAVSAETLSKMRRGSSQPNLLASPKAVRQNSHSSIKSANGIRQREAISFALEAAVKAGIKAENISADNLISGQPHMCLSFLKQLMRLNLLSNIKVTGARLARGSDDPTDGISDVSGKEAALASWCTSILEEQDRAKIVAVSLHGLANAFTGGEIPLLLIASALNKSAEKWIDQPDRKAALANAIREAKMAEGTTANSMAEGLVSGNRTVGEYFAAGVYNLCHPPMTDREGTEKIISTEPAEKELKQLSQEGHLLRESILQKTETLCEQCKADRLKMEKLTLEILAMSDAAARADTARKMAEKTAMDLQRECDLQKEETERITHLLDDSQRSLNQTEDGLRKDLLKEMSDKTALEVTVQELKDSLERQTKASENLLRELDGKNDTINRLSAEKDEFHALSENLQKDLENFKSDRDDLQGTVENANAQIEQLKRSSQEDHLLRQSILQKTETLREQRDADRQKTEKLTLELQEMSDAVARADTARQMAEKTVMDLQRECDLQKEETERITRLLDDSQKILNQTEDGLRSKEKDLVKETSDKTALESTVQELKDSLERQTKASENLLRELDGKNDTINRLSAEKDEFHALSENLQNDLENLKSDLRTTVTVRDNLQGTVENANAQVEQLKQSSQEDHLLRESILQKMETLCEQCDADRQKTEKLTLELQEMSDAVARADMARQMAEKAAMDLQRECDLQKEETERITRLLDDSRKILNQTEDGLRSKEKDLIKEMSDKTALESTVQKLKDSLERQTKASEDSLHELDGKSDTIHRLTSEKEEFHALSENLQKDLENLKSDLQTMVTVNDDLQGTIIQLRLDVEESAKQLHALQADKNTAKEDVRRLEAALQDKDQNLCAILEAKDSKIGELELLAIVNDQRKTQLGRELLEASQSIIATRSETERVNDENEKLNNDLTEAYTSIVEMTYEKYLQMQRYDNLETEYRVATRKLQELTERSGNMTAKFLQVELAETISQRNQAFASLDRMIKKHRLATAHVKRLKNELNQQKLSEVTAKDEKMKHVGSALMNELEGSIIMLESDSSEKDVRIKQLADRISSNLTLAAADIHQTIAESDLYKGETEKQNIVHRDSVSNLGEQVEALRREHDAKSKALLFAMEEIESLQIDLGAARDQLVEKESIILELEKKEARTNSEMLQLQAMMVVNQQSVEDLNQQIRSSETRIEMATQVLVKKAEELEQKENQLRETEQRASVGRDRIRQMIVQITENNAPFLTWEQDQERGQIEKLLAALDSLNVQRRNELGALEMCKKRIKIYETTANAQQMQNTGVVQRLLRINDEVKRLRQEMEPTMSTPSIRPIKG